MSDVLVHPVYTFAIASFIGAFLSIFGDLAASAIKRNHDVNISPYADDQIQEGDIIVAIGLSEDLNRLEFKISSK